MAVLTTDLRNQLARAIQTARREAEAGARKALESQAVHLAKSHDSMDGSERALRGRLRAHGKQLGDVRAAEPQSRNSENGSSVLAAGHRPADPSRTNALSSEKQVVTRLSYRDTQEIDRLAHEVAYEHWHRMLFARFLAENQLLIEPESGVAISMAECEELARENGEDPWALAARFAQRMLPGIFRPDLPAQAGDPALEVILPPETRQALERELASLPSDVFRADDALGWTYQFWQADRKDAVNRAGGKVGADELPAVTQLFTEHYMVLFLFHNTIGAWRAGKIFAERPELAEADSEDAVRRGVRLAALGGYDFTYLRFVRERRDGDEEGQPSGPWRPAAGGFDGWPARASELRVLDPCCGSGHFLVEGFELLVRLRMEEEELSVEDAIRAVLAENLFGLEIDPRCTQIAAFNLALAAWKLAQRIVQLPSLRVACVGIGPQESEERWLGLAEKVASSAAEDEREAIRNGMRRLWHMFSAAPALGSLIDPYRLPKTLIASDYLSLRSPILRFLAAQTSEDVREGVIAASGMLDGAELLIRKYTLVITNVPFRQTGDLSPELGSHVLGVSAEGKANLATVVLRRIQSLLAPGGTSAAVSLQDWLYKDRYEDFREWTLGHQTWNLVARLGPGAFETVSGEVVNVCLIAATTGAPSADAEFHCLDVQDIAGPAAKGRAIRQESLGRVSQLRQRSNPRSVIITTASATDTLLESVATYHNGLQAGDLLRFARGFWELSSVKDGWAYQQTTVGKTQMFAGRTQVFRWENGIGEYRGYVAARLGEQAVRSWIRGEEAWGRDGILVTAMGSLPVSLYTGHLFDDNTVAIIPKDPAILPSLWAFLSSAEYSELVRDTDRSLKVRGGLVRVPFDAPRWRREGAVVADSLSRTESDDPTQWLFHGRPEQSTDSLQVAVARLVGYRWPAELDSNMRLSDRARELAGRCGDLLDFADHDGVVCLPSVRGEKPAADRLLTLLAASGIRPDRDLDEWLRTGFFEEHCKLFHHRPFVWHIWDGREDGFHAFVNYHRLAAPNGEGRRTLEALTYSYLGDWIERQKAEQREGRAGADARLAAAQDLQAQLARILAGEPPCDLFVRWKPLREQPIGWDPDINDGVRLNIRPFMSVALRKGGRSGAGILRWKPNITWKKDRGTEPESLRSKDDFPWFWGCPGDGLTTERTDFMGTAAFDGSRWNDLHYTNAVKHAARERATREVSRV